jgi:hypothetical protein
MCQNIKYCDICTESLHCGNNNNINILGWCEKKELCLPANPLPATCEDDCL